MKSKTLIPIMFLILGILLIIFRDFSISSLLAGMLFLGSVILLKESMHDQIKKRKH